MKRVNARRLRRIKDLKEMINEIDVLKNKKSVLFLKLVDLTKELDGPSLLMDTMILSKETLMGQLNSLKFSWENEFTETIEFSEE
jgi:hypothetical protein